MHEVLEVLFPFIVLLYIIDCIAYVGDQHLLFSSHFGKQFVLRKPGLHLVGLLPISEAVVSHNVPVFLTNRGIYIVRGEYWAKNARYKAENLHFTGYEEVVSIEADGKVVKVNGETLINFPSSTNAEQMRQMLQELTCLEASGRRQKIREFLDETTNLQEIRAIRDNRQPLVHIKILSSILFVNVFGIFPLALYSGLSSYIFLPVVVYLSICVYLLIVIMAYFARRTLFGTKAVQTVLVMIPTILSPVTAIHVVKKLTREIYTRFDYAAVAAALLPSEAFQSAMREELLQIAYAKGEKQNAEVKEFWSLREKALLALLAKTEIRMEQLLAPPKRQDPSAASYCPLCLSEYRPGVEKCADCGIDLREFDDNALESGH